MLKIIVLGKILNIFSRRFLVKWEIKMLRRYENKKIKRIKKEEDIKYAKGCQ